MCRAKSFIHLAVLLALMALGGCSSAVPLDRQPAFVQVAPVGETVSLVLSPEFRAGRTSLYLDTTDDLDLGTPLAHYSEKMLNSMFRKVVVVPSIDQGGGVALQVVPRVVRMEWANGIRSARDRVFDLALEWRVLNSAGQTMLVETVIGEGSANIGSAFSMHSDLNDALGNLMEDTFKKSQARLESELRRL